MEKIIFKIRKDLKKRRIINNIAKWFESNDEMILIIGARQVGKTSIMHLLASLLVEKGIKEHTIIYLDLEDFSILEVLNDGIDNFLNFLRANGVDCDEKNYIFIDEIQYLKNPSNFLKLLVDHHKNFKIIASGSSTLDIRKKFRDSLTGRKITFEIYTLDFIEYLQFIGEDKLSEIVEENSYRNIINSGKLPAIELLTHIFNKLSDYFIEYTIYGGYPRVVLEKNYSKKILILQEIHNTYIRKDIKDLMRIDNITGFNTLIKTLSLQIGNIVNLHELSSSLGINRETLERYLFLLENTFIIKLLSPFFSNKRKELTKMQKVFFCDTGIRNISIKNFEQIDIRPDKGSLIENSIFCELIKSIRELEEIKYWRTQSKNEIDFIIDRNIPLPIEVKYRTFEAPEVPNGFRIFIDTYSTKENFIITKNFIGGCNYNKSKVYFLPPFLT